MSKRSAPPDVSYPSPKKPRLFSIGTIPGPVWSEIESGAPALIADPDPSMPPDTSLEIFGVVVHVHRFILRLHSGYFNASMRESWLRPEYIHSGPDGIKYRYSLEFNEPDPISSVFRAVSRDEAARQRGPRLDEGSSGNELERNEPDHKQPSVQETRLRDSYLSLLSVFYSKPWMGFEDHINLFRLLQMVQVADFLTAIPPVKMEVEMILLRCFTTNSAGIYTSDLLLPPIIEIAFRIRSKEFFQEAFVHFVGQFKKYPKSHIERVLSEDVLALVLRGHIELEAKRVQVDRKLLCIEHELPHLEIVLAFRTFQSDKNERKLYQSVRSYSKRDVEPLLVNNSRIDRSEVGHLTCTDRLKDGEFPWQVAEHVGFE